MSAKHLDSCDIKKQEELDDITTCCICTDVYIDPKALPCIHTFCMKCLQETGLKTDKRPGDEMPCPICRRMFKIPTEGFHGLPKNFFIERLIQVSKVSDPSAESRDLCSLCLEESNEQEVKETPAADTYCVDCKYKLCEECCSEHRKFKATKNHKLISITEYRSYQNMMTELAPVVCEVHEVQKVLDVYCADCKTVVCAICFIDDHNNHKGSHVNKFVDGFRKQMESNAEVLNECRSKYETRKVKLLKVKEDIQERVKKLQCEVANRIDELKQLIDRHATSLLQGLCSIKQSKLKEIQMATDDVDTYLSCVEAYNSYCQKIMDKGSASDICCAFQTLSVRAMELQQQCQPTIEREIQSFNFCFRKTDLEDFLEEACGNLIGEIEEEGDSKPKKRSKQSLLAEQSNEIDRLRKENQIQKEKEDLRSANEQLKISINKQANDALTEELRMEKTNNDAHIKELKQRLNDNKIAHDTLQVNNDKFVQEVNLYKTMIRILEENVDKLEQELEATQKDKDRSEYKSDPVFVQTIATKAAEEGNKSIRGLTILDKELFVVSDWSSEVEVYNSMKLTFSRRWNLKELIDPRDLASCSRNKCLYIFDSKGLLDWKEILRVDTNGKLIKNWSTGNDWGWSLSVTDESNVILTVYVNSKINEYAPDGQLIREINLSSYAGIRYPQHAIKLTNGHFVISHADGDRHRVCMVGADGKVIRWKTWIYRGSTFEQRNHPIYLTVDKNGLVIVADCDNCRVSILDSELQFKRQILSKNGNHELRYPERILLDELNGRLFVADNDLSKKRLLVFNFRLVSEIL